MRRVRPTHSALATAASLGVAAILLAATASAVFADTPAADADTVTAGVQGTLDLGQVAPGATMTVPLDFVLTCSGTSHVDSGETVTIAFAGGSMPEDGSATFDTAQIGPITTFPADGDGCSSPPQTVRTTTPMHADLTAPTVPGRHEYTFMFGMSVSNGDSTAIARMAFATLDVTVVSNTPPTLQLPAPFTVEGTETGGATVTYAASATDLEDATPPAVSCSPASGSHLALGTTSVGCSARDQGGLTTTGSFDVTVVDTTPPTIATRPDVSVITQSASGASVAFSLPAASDKVDADPHVACAPASGSWFPIGTTAVTCTAADTSGNHASSAFVVTVRRGDAAFDAPIGPSNVVDANGSRSIPVKAQLTIDGSDLTNGTVGLVVAPCDGGTAVQTMSLTFASGRWTGKLDTSALGPGCWRANAVFASSDGRAVLGGFDVRIPATASSSKATPATSNRPKR